MSAKTITIIIIIVLLVWYAGQPIGQAISAIGGAIQSFGNEIAILGAKLHGG